MWKVEVPADLRPDIRAAAVAILETAREAGWRINPVRWESKSRRKLWFTAQSPSGVPVYAVCAEIEFPERLEALLISD
jgi:hypothetical protein